jgi:membrane associated rhomboid family serine protease
MVPVRSSVPVRYPPVATYGLIGINVLVFVFQTSLPADAEEAFLYFYGLVPARYTDPVWALRIGLSPDDYLPFVTNMFLHGGWLHLILNMWTLWLFGGAVEDRLGHGRYLVFYMVCGLAAGGAHAWVNADSTVPAVGASGAIAGVLGAYVRFFPRSWIILLVPVLFIPFFFEVPALAYVALWFGLQVFQGALQTIAPEAGGVAWWAHIGGFLAGVVLAPVIHRPRPAYRRYYADEGVLGFGTRGQR